MAFGIMLAVAAVLAATLTLLPAVLGKLGTNINKGRIRLRRRPAVEGEGPLDRMLHRWGRYLWRHPFPTSAAALLLLVLAAAPIIGCVPTCRRSPSSRQRECSSRLQPGDRRIRTRAPGTLQVVVPQPSSLGR